MYLCKIWISLNIKRYWNLSFTSLFYITFYMNLNFLEILPYDINN